LTHAQISGLQNDPGTHGVETEATFNFSKVMLTDHPRNPDGSFATPQTFSFDLAAEKTAAAVASAVTTDAAAALAIDATTLVPAVQAATPVPDSSPLHYFLKVTGVDGDVTTGGFAKWYAVDGFDFGVTTPFSLAAGGGPTGKAAFTPLTGDIHSLTGLALLFNDELQNKRIDTVELVGAQQNGGKEQTVYDLKLTHAQISGLQNDPGTHGVETQATFNFSKVTLTDHPRNPDGSFATPQTFSFDLAAEKTAAAVASAVTTDAAAALAIDATTLVPAVQTATPVPDASPLHYFLKVTGVDGDVTTGGFAKWYAVDGFDFGVTTPFSLAAGGGPTGKAAFTPLTVDIHSLTGLALLFNDELQNKSIDTVELVGAQQIGG